MIAIVARNKKQKAEKLRVSTLYYDNVKTEHITLPSGTGSDQLVSKYI